MLAGLQVNCLVGEVVVALFYYFFAILETENYEKMKISVEEARTEYAGCRYGTTSLAKSLQSTVLVRQYRLTGSDVALRSRNPSFSRSY
jgi:hypothetical protein